METHFDLKTGNNGINVVNKSTILVVLFPYFVEKISEYPLIEESNDSYFFFVSSWEIYSFGSMW